MKLERYGFLDARNVEVGGLVDRIEPAKETARANGWKLIACAFRVRGQRARPRLLA